MRLEVRLQVEWFIDPDTAACQLPPLSLHSLVENGIKHGINQLEAGGIITVRIVTSPTHWEITVINDGGYQPSASSGSGLHNLRQRLQLHYGDAASLLINNNDTSPTPSTIAHLKIPCS
jgi:LytS/YehU family sensor histidine kinase